MRLGDLEPRWIYKTKVFAFLCPHCRKAWLTCKRVEMGTGEQMAIIERAFPDRPAPTVVPCKTSVAWKFSSLDLATISVQPSLDASASGHWHGHITNGQIVGGEQA